MLHLETVEPGTLAVLNRLMEVPVLAKHALVGGTTLALRYGHRLSIDLDLFTDEDQATEDILAALRQTFGDELTARRNQQAKWAVFAFIGGVKIDVVRFPHKRIAPIVVSGNIRMYADEDIGPMKVESILHRARKKDFWDLAELLDEHGLQWLIEHHRKKYPNNDILMSVPEAIIYFKDAEADDDPVSLKGQTWRSVKQRISNAVERFTRP
jgi:hypothetical protein